MEKRLIPISHEPMRERTVKSVCPLDAEVRYRAIRSALTNKEETFLYMQLAASATECVGAVLPVFLRVLHRFYMFYTVSHRLHRFMFYSNQVDVPCIPGALDNKYIKQ